jgi:cell division protease FtsH
MRTPFRPVGNQEDPEAMRKSNISLSSWAGSPEVFEECTEVISFLKNATAYEAVGAELPKGILLEGPPGTGKTLLAKAIASEANANFYSVSGSEFIELYVGLGAAKVRELFTKARANRPAIIFIDEIDTIGKQRGGAANFGGSTDERDQTLNQMLAEMDGFVDNRGVIVLAATNRRDILDSALLRPGRFDRILPIPLPDNKSRRAILAVHTKNKTMNAGIDYAFLADAMAGYSGAQIKNVINEAAIYAARANNRSISQDNIEQALEKTMVGIIKKTEDRPEEVVRRVAIHEMGHALLVKYFSENYVLKKVTIQSAYGGTGGYTLFTEASASTDDKLYTKDVLCERLAIALGGKAAEQLYYGTMKMSLGAIQDLKEANGLARQMIEKYGMGKRTKVFYKTDTFRDVGEAMNAYSDKTKELVDDEVAILVKEAYERALHTLSKYKATIDKIVPLLLKQTTIRGDDVRLEE